MPATTKPNVGVGAQATLATTGITLKLKDVRIGGVTVNSIDVTTHATTLPAAGELNSRDFEPGKHVTLESIELDAQYDPAIRDALRVKQTITITDPDGNTFSGNGFVDQITWPNFDVADDAELIMTARIKPRLIWTYTET